MPEKAGIHWHIVLGNPCLRKVDDEHLKFLLPSGERGYR